MKKKLILNLSVFLAFALSLILSKLTNHDYYKLLPGILMIYYLPGNNLNDLVLLNYPKKISWNTRLALDLVSSISVIYLGHSILKNNIDYIENKSYVFVIAINILLFLANVLTYWKLRRRYSAERILLNNATKRILLIFSIPIFLLMLRLVLNPYIYELDSSQYFHIFNNILAIGYDISWLTGQRNGFALYMVYSKYICGIDFVGFIKFFTPFLFYIASLPLFDLANKIKNKPLSALTYLLIIGSPFLTIGNEGVRPETFMFIFTIPIFYLIYLSLEDSWISLLILAIVFSYVSFRFHEFGVFAILASFIGLAILIYKQRSSIITFTRKNPRLIIFLLLPYLIMLKQNPGLLNSVFSAEIFHYTVVQLKDFANHPSWRWWFLNNFTCIDGGIIQWPGYTFIQYYLYNGLGVIFLFSLLVISLVVLGRGKRLIVRNILTSSSFPIVVFLIAYSIIAELFPRMGLFLLPNRTWPHIILAMIFLLPIMIINIEKSRKTLISFKILSILFGLAIFAGTIGSMVGSVYMGGQVLPGEKGVIKQIKSLPADSIVVTTQVNENLVEMYGGKVYIPIEKVKFNDQSKFLAATNSAIEQYPQKYNESLLNNFVVSESSYVSVAKNNKQSNILKENKSHVSYQDKLQLIKQYIPNEYTDLESEINKFDKIAEKPVYFVYSFAKFKGILAKRQWWYEDNDPQNLELLRNYSGSDVIYRDKNAILIKIR